jgi:hypothetical protein
MSQQLDRGEVVFSPPQLMTSCFYQPQADPLSLKLVGEKCLDVKRLTVTKPLNLESLVYQRNGKKERRPTGSKGANDSLSEEILSMLEEKNTNKSKMEEKAE